MRLLLYFYFFYIQKNLFYDFTLILSTWFWFWGMVQKVRFKNSFWWWDGHCWQVCVKMSGLMFGPSPTIVITCNSLWTSACMLYHHHNIDIFPYMVYQMWYIICKAAQKKATGCYYDYILRRWKNKVLLPYIFLFFF